MADDIELLKKRFTELSRKADSGVYYAFTDFLGLSEQTAFHEAMQGERIPPRLYTLYGGAPECERVMVRFGDPEDIGYEEPFPISLIRAKPISEKFADKLTHRDFLGALMNIGIERSVLGDIVIIDNVGYIFAKGDIADYISESLSRVKHTDIKAEVIEKLPEGELFITEQRRVQIQSERLDAIIAKVYSLSRDDAQLLFKKGLVFASGRECVSTSYNPKAGEKISVRGYGRFIWRGWEGTSRKGKLNGIAEVYI